MRKLVIERVVIGLYGIDNSVSNIKLCLNITPFKMPVEGNRKGVGDTVAVFPGGVFSGKCVYRFGFGSGKVSCCHSDGDHRYRPTKRNGKDVLHADDTQRKSRTCLLDGGILQCHRQDDRPQRRRHGDGRFFAYGTQLAGRSIRM